MYKLLFYTFALIGAPRAQLKANWTGSNVGRSGIWRHITALMSKWRCVYTYM